jgi:hypothetical protein
VLEIDSFLKGNNRSSLIEKIEYFREAMGNCRLFATEGDITGIAPQNAQEGDVVCILKGAYSPCILRHIAMDQWSLVSGNCYLQGHGLTTSCRWGLWDHCKGKGMEETHFFIC